MNRKDFNWELQHKLELIQIHKDVMDINQKSILEMGNYCPPHIKLDYRDRQNSIAKLFEEVNMLVEKGVESTDSNIKSRLSTLKDEKVISDGISLVLGISIIKSILEMPKSDEEVNLQKQHFGGTVVILNSKNIVVNSDFKAGGSIDLGDDS